MDNYYLCIDGPLDGQRVPYKGPSFQLGPFTYRLEGSVYRYEGLLLTSAQLEAAEADSLSWEQPLTSGATEESNCQSKETRISPAPTAAPGSVAECRQRLNGLDRELASLVKEAQSLIAEGRPILALQKFVAYYQEESALLERIQQLQPSDIIARVYRHALAMWESSQFVLANRVGRHSDEIQEAAECALAEVEASQLSSEQWRQFWTHLDALQRPAAAVLTAAPLDPLPLSPQPTSSFPPPKRNDALDELICALLAIVFSFVLMGAIFWCLK